MRTQKRVQKLVLKWSQIRHRKIFLALQKDLTTSQKCYVALWVLVNQIT